MTASSFADHQWLLANDDTYRRRKGLAPLPALSPVDDPDPLPTGDSGQELPAAGVDAALFRRLRALADEQKELRRRDKELTVEIDRLQTRLIDQYTSAGTDQQVYDGHAGTLHTQLWARKRDESVTGARVAEALRADGLGHLVAPEGYNSQQLSAYLRDLEEEGKPIPQHLAELIEGTEVSQIRFTKRRASRARRRMTGADSSVLDAGGQPGAS